MKTEDTCVFFQLCFSHGIGPVVGLLGHKVVLFLVFLSNIHTVLHNDCINLHSHEQFRKVPFSPHPLHHLQLVDFFVDSHSDQREVIPHCSFDCISLIMSDVEHFFMC